MTSTPIKRDKENVHGAHRGVDGGGGVAGGGGGAWSPSILQTSGGARRHFLKETNDVRNGVDRWIDIFVNSQTYVATYIDRFLS